MMRKTVICILISICFMYFFLVFDLKFRGPDEPVYFAYTESLLADKDLNIVNQIDYKQYPYYFPSGRYGISRTYNLPDYHNHGGIVLWAPFYGYAKILSWRNHSDDLETLPASVMSFSTLVFGIFTLILTYFLCRIFFTPAVSIWSSIVLFLGTPFFYFMLYESGNANIIACLFSVISIWFLSFALSAKKSSHWFLYGLFFAVATVVKTEIWFQLVFVALIFSVFLVKKQTDWKKGVFFVLGLIPALLLRNINDCLKYGSVHLSEFKLFDFKRNFCFFEQLFSPYRGFFYTSPVFYLCLAGLVIIMINLLKASKAKEEKNIQDLFFFILASYAMIKIFFLSYRYAWGGGTPGARILLTEIPVFVLLYARFFSSTKGSIRYSVVLLSLIFIFWNLLVISEYMAGVDLTYAAQGAPALTARLGSLSYIFNVFKINGLEIKFKFLLPAAGMALAAILYMSKKLSWPIDPASWFMKEKCRSAMTKPFAWFAIYLIFAYTFITALNLYNNKKNASKLKAGGFFRGMTVIGPGEFERQENAGSLDEMIEYYELKKEHQKAVEIRKIKEELYNEK